MAVPPVSDEIDDDIVVIFRSVRHGKSHSRETRLRVVCVDMDDRKAEPLGEVAGVPCRPAVHRQRGKSDLIVEDDVDGAACRVPVQPAEIEGFRDHALSRESCISVDENRDHRCGIPLRVLVVSGVLERPRHALHDRVHELEVAGIGSEGDVNRGSVGETLLAPGALVVLDVSGALDREGPFCLDPLELAGDLLVSEPHDVGQDVEAAAVGHPQHNPLGADFARLLEREIQHGNHDVGPLDGEALLAEVRIVEKLLQALDLGKPLEKAHPVSGLERARVGAGFNLIPEPPDHAGVLEVFELVSDRPAVGLPESLEYVSQGLVARVLEHQRGGEFGELLQARAEEGGIELWVSGRLGAQGIDGGKLMPVVTVGLNERRRVGDGTEEVGYRVRLSRCGAQVGGDHRRCRACLRVGAAATVLGQAFGDDQTGLGRGLWAQGKEIPPLSRYALRVSRELFIQGLGVGGVLAVERLFVHRFRCSRGAFLEGC